MQLIETKIRLPRLIAIFGVCLFLLLTAFVSPVLAADGFQIDLEAEGSALDIWVNGLSGNTYTLESIEYRYGSDTDWREFTNAGDYQGGDEANGIIRNIDIPNTSTTIQVRAKDNQSGTYWPQPTGYAEITTSIGTASDDTILYSEGFESYSNCTVTSPGTLNSSCGGGPADWFVGFGSGSGPDGTRLKTHATSGFAQTGSKALTIEGEGDDGVYGDDYLELTLSDEYSTGSPYDFSSYYQSMNIVFEVGVMSHDSTYMGAEAEGYQAQNNHISICVPGEEGSSCTQMYDVYTEATVGSYETVTKYLNEYVVDFESNISFKFKGEYVRSASSISGEEGYTIDDIVIKHVASPFEAGGDTTDPTITFSDEPQTFEGSTIDIAGTAIEDESTISTVTVTYDIQGGSSPTTVTATPTDGSFNSASENFTVSISGLTQGQIYDIEVQVENSESLTGSYNYTSTIDGTNPTITLDSEPGNYISGTQNLQLTGSAIDAVGLLDSVTVDYTSDTTSQTVSATADDGAFDEATEDFTATITDLGTGEYAITITVTDTTSNSTEYSYSGQIDATNPDFHLDHDPEFIGTVDFTLEGLAADNLEIANITTSLTTASLGTVSPATTADDGAFDEAAEDFTVDVTGATAGEAFDLTITVTDTAGSSLSRTYEGIIGKVYGYTIPNLGQTPSADTTPTYNGSVVTTGANVATVEYSVFTLANDYYPDNAVEVAWTAVTPDDIFDSPAESFSFTTPPLTDGVKSIDIRAYDTDGNLIGSSTTTGSGPGETVDRIIINAEDTTAPNIELQPVIPAPTYDNTPRLSGRVKDDEDDLTSNIASIEYQIDDSGNWTSLSAFDSSFDESTEEFHAILPALNIGDHTVTVRAIDTEGNSTTDESKNQTESFTIRAQNAPQPGKASKTADFTSHTDHDQIASENAIWGEGKVRLKQTVSIESSTLVTDNNFLPRYGSTGDQNMHLAESNCDGGGLWISKAENSFSYYDFDTDTEHDFLLSEYGIVNQNSGDIIEHIDPDGECHVWVGASNNLLAINFGDSIVDDTGDSYTVYDVSAKDNPAPGVDGSIQPLGIDPRVFEGDENDYGLYYRFPNGTDGGVGYIRPGTISTQSDDETVDYESTADYDLYNVTSMYVDVADGNNEIWFTDYNTGIIKINDQGTPLVTAGDEGTLFATDYSGQILTAGFDLGENSNGQIFAVGNFGIAYEINYGASFGIRYTSNQLGASALTEVALYDDDPIVHDQYFMANRAGQIAYLNNNGGIGDTLDDEYYLLDVSGSQYPVEVSDFVLASQNTLYVLLDRAGVYKIDLNREFADTGTAVSKIYATLEGDYLDVDYISLDDISFVDNSGSTSYRVSNDAGATWQGIALGETVNFSQPGYQLTFAIDMTKGSTPILDDYLLTYAGYASSSSRGLSLDIANEPGEIEYDESFSFNVRTLDAVSNPLSTDTTVTLELRRSSDNKVVGAFNKSSANIIAGNATVSGAKAKVLGKHYIYAYNSEVATRSDDINFVESTAEQIIPELSFSADKYIINPGDTVKLSWSSTKLETLHLKQGDTDLGLVDLEGEQWITLYNTSSFTLEGNGQHGHLNADITIELEADEEIDSATSIEDVEKNNLSPRIISFKLETIEQQDEKSLLELSWDVENVNSVTISGLGKNLAPSGSRQIYVKEDSTFVLTAKNDQGQKQVSRSYDYKEKTQSDSPDSLINIPSLFGGEKKSGQNDEVVLGESSWTISLGLPILTYLLFFLSFGQFTSPKLAYRLMQALGIFLKRKPLGIVFNHKTDEVIPFAILTIKSTSHSGTENKKQALIQETIVSDTKGVYQEMSLPSGDYVMDAAHSEHTFPVDKAKLPVSLWEYYRGEPFSIKSPRDKKPFLVPMKPRKQLNFRRKFSSLIRMFVAKLNYVNFTLPLTIFSVIVAILYPTWINLIIVALYAFFAILWLRRFLERPVIVGQVSDKTGKPIKNALVRVGNIAANRFVSVVHTNSRGKFSIYAKKDLYQIEIVKPGYVWLGAGAAMSLPQVDTRKGQAHLNTTMKPSESAT